MKKEIEFENQRPDEEVVLFAHQHPWMMAKTGFAILVLILITFIAFLIFKSVPIRLIVSGAVLLIITLIVVVRWFTFANTFFIITNERIIYISQKSLFKKRVQETELVNIYNLSYKIEGFWPSLLNFGNIKMTTEGDFTDCIELENIENPHFVHEKLSHLHNLANANKSD